MLNDPLANALSKILNAENLGRSSCLIKPISTVVKNVLKIMQTNQYIGDYNGNSEFIARAPYLQGIKVLPQ